MPNRPVRDQYRNTRGKWNDIFRLNRVNQEVWLLSIFIPFPNSLIRANKRFVKNGTANFSRNIPTEISGPLPEMVPNNPVEKINRNGPFRLNSDRKLQADASCPTRHIDNQWQPNNHVLISR